MSSWPEPANWRTVCCLIHKSPAFSFLVASDAGSQPAMTIRTDAQTPCTPGVGTCGGESERNRENKKQLRLIAIFGEFALLRWFSSLTILISTFISPTMSCFGLMTDIWCRYPGGPSTDLHLPARVIGRRASRSRVREQQAGLSREAWVVAHTSGWR